MSPDKSKPKRRIAESAFIPHVGWLQHDRGEEVISLLRQGYFEAHEQAFFYLYLRPGDTFIDGGAHIGLYSVIAHRTMGGRGVILAAEPNASTAAHLRTNLESNGVTGVTVVPAALWKEPGRIGFVKEAQGRAAFAHVSFEPDQSGATVPAVTLDGLIAEAGLPRVALVKIDVEGAEPEALQGAAESIRNDMLPLLMVEVAEHNLRSRGLATHDLVSQLQSMGYSLCEFSPESMLLQPRTIDGPIWFQNIFACKSLAEINARLRSANKERRDIARDILGRAAACARFKELEELDRLQKVAEMTEGYREWAERTEQLLAAERGTTEELRQAVSESHGRIQGLQAEKQATQARVEAAERLAADNQAWGERSDNLVEQQRKSLAEMEGGLRAAEKLAGENREWAQRTEAILAAKGAEAEQLAGRLAEAEQLAASNLAWAQRSDHAVNECREALAEMERRIAAANVLAEENREWAQRSEALLVSQRADAEGLSVRLAEAERRAQDNQVWAERSEQLVEAQKAIFDELSATVTAKERNAEENRAWAERAEMLVAAQKTVSDGLAQRLGAQEALAAENRRLADRTEELLEAQKRSAAELAVRFAKETRAAQDAVERALRAEAGLEAAQAEIAAVREAMRPLQRFAERFSWIYRLSNRAGRRN